MRTIYTVEFVSEGMVSMLRSFDHPFEIDCPTVEMIEVSTLGGRPIHVAGKQPPITVTLHDSNDALLFKLKYFKNILYTDTTEETPWEYN